MSEDNGISLISMAHPSHKGKREKSWRRIKKELSKRWTVHNEIIREVEIEIDMEKLPQYGISSSLRGMENE